jgi:hypothetical protein
MLQNLNHYETLLARTHTNYLAKISIELTHTSNSTNLVIGRLTIFATILLPMNLITGIWGKAGTDLTLVIRDDTNVNLLVFRNERQSTRRGNAKEKASAFQRVD